MHFSYDCWEGQLPLVRKSVPNNDVIFFNILYGSRLIKLNGLDYYFGYAVEGGFVAGGWTDPTQPWASKSWVGRKYTFDNNNNRVSAKDLITVPVVESFHSGIMVPDNIARQLDLI